MFLHIYPQHILLIHIHFMGIFTRYASELCLVVV